MSEGTPRPPAQVLASIQQKAQNVRLAATTLSEHIEKVEATLAKMPGRMEAHCYGAHPDADEDNPVELALRFSRDGKTWRLSWGTYHHHYTDPDNPIEYEPLTEASLKVKMAAVKLFPELLNAIEGSQEKMASELEKATLEAEAFLDVLKMREKEAN